MRYGNKKGGDFERTRLRFENLNRGDPIARFVGILGKENHKILGILDFSCGVWLLFAFGAHYI